MHIFLKILRILNYRHFISDRWTSVSNKKHILCIYTRVYTFFKKRKCQRFQSPSVRLLFDVILLRKFCDMMYQISPVCFVCCSSFSPVHSPMSWVHLLGLRVVAYLLLRVSPSDLSTPPMCVNFLLWMQWNGPGSFPMLSSIQLFFFLSTV